MVGLIQENLRLDHFDRFRAFFGAWQQILGLLFLKRPNPGSLLDISGFMPDKEVRALGKYSQFQLMSHSNFKLQLSLS